MQTDQKPARIRIKETRPIGDTTDTMTAIHYDSGNTSYAEFRVKLNKSLEYYFLITTPMQESIAVKIRMDIEYNL